MSTSSIELDPTTGWCITSSSQYYLSPELNPIINQTFQWLCTSIEIPLTFGIVNHEIPREQIIRGNAIQKWLQSNDWESLEHVFFHKTEYLIPLPPPLQIGGVTVTDGDGGNNTNNPSCLMDLHDNEIVRNMVYSMLLVETCRISDDKQARMAIKRLISYGVDINAPNINAMKQVGEASLVRTTLLLIYSHR